MSKYLLKVTGSNEIINIIEWDGSGSMVAPSGYEFELFVTESTDFINYFESIDLDNIPVISGNLLGKFTGELTGSITLNGEAFDEIIHKTKYGSLTLLSGSNIVTVSESMGMLLSHNSIILPQTSIFNNEDYSFTVNYNAVLNKIIDENISNYVISFKQKDNPTVKLEYLVHQTELTSSGTSSYYNISASLFGTASFIRSADEIFNSHDFISTNWYVDFDLGDTPTVGKFYGDFNGTIGGKKIENIINTLIYDNTSQLAFNSTTTLGSMEVCPPVFSFRFPTDPIDWTQPINRVTLNALQYNLEGVYDATSFYTNKLLSIINEGLDSQVLTIRSTVFPNTYKKLRIINGTYYINRDMSLQPTDSNYNLCFEVNWGMKLTDFSNRDNVKISNNCDRFDQSDYLNENQKMWIDSYTKDPLDSLWNEPIAYFDLQVEEIESNYEWYKPYRISPNGVLEFAPESPTVQPSSGYYDESVNDIFVIEFETLGVGIKKKEVFEFTSTTTPWTVPSWADKITIYSIGAGGGGGGGSAGWGHNKNATKISISIPKEWNFDSSYASHFINDFFGFEFATGGGGGAGGNIAVSEFTIDKTGRNINSTNIGKTVLPKDSKLNIYVGSGGEGGRGLTNNSSDYINITKLELNDFRRNSYGDPKRLHELSPSKMVWLHSLLDRNTLTYRQFTDDSYNSILKAFLTIFMYEDDLTDNSYFKIQVGNSETFGKDGGFSSVFLDSTSNTVTNINIELVKAKGGFGAMNGVSLQSYYHPYHRNCGITLHSAIDPRVLGGGSTFNDSFGNKDIRPGGSGGFGVSMPNLFQRGVYDSTLKLRSVYFDGIVQPPDGAIESYIAVDIPINKSSRNLGASFGHVYKFSQGETYENSGYKRFIESYHGSIPNNLEIAPLGGNGGLGVNTMGIENRQASEVVYTDEGGFDEILWQLKNGQFAIGIPDDWYIWMQEQVQESIIYGNNYRSKLLNSNTLISTNVTAVNGIPKSTYEFRLKDTGALGGLDIYSRTDGTPIELTSIPLAERVPTQPENGGDYGQGGGGGAAAYTTDWSQRTTPIQGQNGGDGANGIVIIIAEEL